VQLLENFMEILWNISPGLKKSGFLFRD
jgi:hypothetical protein